MMPDTVAQLIAAILSFGFGIYIGRRSHHREMSLEREIFHNREQNPIFRRIK